MKNQSFKTVKRTSHFLKCDVQEMHSKIVEELLKMTFPNYEKLLAYKKKTLLQVIFDYFFFDDESKFYEIETFTNVATACHLKGYRWLIKKNNVGSLYEFDKLMIKIKSKSLNHLNQSLSQHEVLADKEKTKILGGKRSNQLLPNIFILTKKLLSA